MKCLLASCLLCFAFAIGCSASSGTAGDANDPATSSDAEQMENVDEAAEPAATSS